MCVLFEYSNEPLPAIMHGLGITKYDSVLSVCCSGDQALAMAALGARVTAADINPAQVEYAIAGQAEIIKGDFSRYTEMNPRIKLIDRILGISDSKLCDLELIKQRNKFFRTHLETLISGASNVKFITADIYGQDPAQYNKIYLYNADLPASGGISLIGSAVPGTLFYVSDEFMYCQIKKRCPMQTKIDDELTDKARDYPGSPYILFRPIIFIRTE
ncbi:MAG: class I SAM-dependent methyltransferase [archaeon]